MRKTIGLSTGNLVLGDILRTKVGKRWEAAAVCGISATRLTLRLPNQKTVTRTYDEVKAIRISAKFLRRWGFEQAKGGFWHRPFGDYILEASREGEFFRLLRHDRYVTGICWQGYFMHLLTHDMLTLPTSRVTLPFSLPEISYAMRRSR
ncbi:MAG: hypothetical protein IJJ56_11290 [Prevotella sp.]|nr:hypothetical protein [Prevotella sp.]